MKLATAVLIFLSVVLCTIGVNASQDYRNQFEAFKSKFGKQYASPAEESTRFNAFVQNSIVAAGHQALNPHAKFGVNKFSDMTAEEFKVYHRSEKYYAAMSANATNFYSAPPRPQAPEKVDWRTKGAVTPVKNQGQCGSCWAFSSTGSIEGQWKIAGHELVSVSEQELVSCDTTDDGCNGGLMDNAFKWIISAKKGWTVTEASYPYRSGGGFAPSCSLSGKKQAAQITGYHNIQHNEVEMANFVYASGPLSIGVDATSWQTYNEGIMTNCISQQMDHGVLIVGFDDTHKPPYWIIKNSWGADWGEHGYIRVEMNRNECLVKNSPCSAIAAK